MLLEVLDDFTPASEIYPFIFRSARKESFTNSFVNILAGDDEILFSMGQYSKHSEFECKFSRPSNEATMIKECV